MKHGDCTNEVGHCSTFSPLWEHIATVQDHATQHCHLGPQDPRKDHSRLSRARCLQMNSQVAAFFAIYKYWTLLHRTNVRISANVAKTSRNVSWHVCSFCEFLSNSIFSPLMLMKRFRNFKNSFRNVGRNYTKLPRSLRFWRIGLGRWPKNLRLLGSFV
jgi:hypothetical protein